MDLTLALMDLNHLIAHADMVAVTDLEHELLKRLEALDDSMEELKPVAEVMNESNVGAADLSEILKVMAEYNCDDAYALRAKLKRADDFYDLALDIDGAILHRLVKLVEEIS